MNLKNNETIGAVKRSSLNIEAKINKENSNKVKKYK